MGLGITARSQLRERHHCSDNAKPEISVDLLGDQE